MPYELRQRPAGLRRARGQAAAQPGWQTQTMPVTDAPAEPYQAPYAAYQYRPSYSTGYVKPRNPRKRGPILFWFTLALIATGVGTLGIIDVSGTSVPDAAYPALALALTGAMLLLGAFWGRAGGLIFIGLDRWPLATLGATGDGQLRRRAPHLRADQLAAGPRLLRHGRRRADARPLPRRRRRGPRRPTSSPSTAASARSR